MPASETYHLPDGAVKPVAKTTSGGGPHFCMCCAGLRRRPGLYRASEHGLIDPSSMTAIREMKEGTRKHSRELCKLHSMAGAVPCITGGELEVTC